MQSVLGWKIAREIAGRYYQRAGEDWALHHQALDRRLAELEGWPAGRACPRWRLAEAWTAVVWGASYAIAAGGGRLALWRESNAHHGRRLDAALARYERYAHVRPAQFPAGGVGGFVAWLVAQHGEHTPPRCMAYDVAGFARFTTQMRAYARAQDPAYPGRAAARAQRRAAQAAYEAQHTRLGFRRSTPDPAIALERARRVTDALAEAEDPGAPRPAQTLPALTHAREELAAAQRAAQVRAGQLPSNLTSAADAYQRRWLSGPA